MRHILLITAALCLLAPRCHAWQATFKTLASGSVTRPAVTPLTGAISLQDFGAVGDGVTDDTKAVQDAANYVAANGGCIVGNPLTYKLTSALLISGNFCLNLLSTDNGVLFQTGADDVIRLGTPNNATVTLQNLTLRGGTNGLNFNSTGTYLSNLSSFTNLSVVSFSAAGININNQALIGITLGPLNIATTTGTYGILATGNNGYLGVSTWTNVWVGGASRCGISLQNTDAGASLALLFVNPIVEANLAKGWCIDSTQVTSYGGHLEGNGRVTGDSDIYLTATAESGASFYMLGGTFSTASPAQENLRIYFNSSKCTLQLAEVQITSSSIIDGNNQTAASAIILLENKGIPTIKNFTGSTYVLSGGAVAQENLTIAPLKATSGTRYVCVDTSGNLTSSASPCRGT
jgi:hypothetical protein